MAALPGEWHLDDKLTIRLTSKTSVQERVRDLVTVQGDPARIKRNAFHKYLCQTTKSSDAELDLYRDPDYFRCALAFMRHGRFALSAEPDASGPAFQPDPRRLSYELQAYGIDAPICPPRTDLDNFPVFIADLPAPAHVQVAELPGSGAVTVKCALGTFRLASRVSYRQAIERCFQAGFTAHATLSHKVVLLNKLLG